jgi:hypothetical protein
LEYIQISATIVSVSSISGIPVLERPPSWCTLTASFDVLHSSAHTGGRAANFTETTTSAKRELTVNTLHKLKFVKTTLSNMRFVQIPKSNKDLV